MGWFENISDFIYLSYEWLGPFVYGPVVLLGILLSVPAVIIFGTLQKVLGIPPKYKDYFDIGICITVFLLLFSIISISLAHHPPLAWMEDP